jgi:hypothetical protein
LIPLEKKWIFLDVCVDVTERVDPVFFADPMTAAMKALETMYDADETRFDGDDQLRLAVKSEVMGVTFTRIERND